MKLTTLILLSLLPFCISAKFYQDALLSFGTVVRGENRLPFSLKKNFDFKVELPEKIKYKVSLIQNSVQWIRIEEVLLTPRAKISINLKVNPDEYHLRYGGRSILLQKVDNYAHSEFYISLFHTGNIDIIHKGNKVGKIQVVPIIKDKKENKTLIDYSCSRYNIQISGTEGEFISVGCKMHPVGNFGTETPMLEVYWTTSHSKLNDQSMPPYIAVFHTSKPIQFTLNDDAGNTKKIKLDATLPPRLHRLRTAYGFGPYAFNTSNSIEELSVPMAPTFMFYMNFNLDQNNSIRGFESLTFHKSIFNNAGIYHANDIAKIMDNKLIITTLIGFQALYFKFDEDSESINEIIGPQGIEILWRHAFDIENYIVSYGMFLSPSQTYNYSNIWLRWGKGIFWELNYIKWGKDTNLAEMYGLSLGLPFKGFF